MNLYQSLSSTHFAIKLLNHFLGILLVGFVLNMGIVLSVQADAVGDKPSDALEINFGQEYSDEMSSLLGTFFNDKDFYKFELPNDGYITISLRTEDISTSLPPDGWAGKLYKSTENGALGSALRNISLLRDDKIAFYGEGLPAGTYYIEISCTFFESLACNPESYYLKVDFEESDFYEKTPNEDLTTATSIHLNQEYIGNLSSYTDVDYYKFQLSQDSNVTFTLSHDDSSLTSKNIFWNGALKNSNSELLHTLSLQGVPNTASVQEKLLTGIYYIKIDTDQTPSYTTNKPKPSAQYHITIDITVDIPKTELKANFTMETKVEPKGSSALLKVFVDASSSEGEIDKYSWTISNIGRSSFRNKSRRRTN